MSDSAAAAIGAAGIGILAAIRKAKSDRKVSIKTPISRLHLLGEAKLGDALDDLGHTVSAAEIIWCETDLPAGEAIVTEDGAYRMLIELTIPGLGAA